MPSANFFSSCALPIVGFALWLFSAPLTHAVNRDTDAPIRINARSVEADEKTGVTVYQGKVHVEQGQLSIKADRIEIRSGKGKSEVMRATGQPARLQQLPSGDFEEIQGEAKRIDYHISKKQIELSGEVALQRGNDLFTGGVLHYNLDTKTLRATGDDAGDGLIHAVINPKPLNAGPAGGP